MSDPIELQDALSETDRFTLDVPATDASFLERFAAYRNALARAQGKRLRRQWSRKGMAESLLAAQVDGMRQQMAEMLKDLGDLPAADDKDALEAYAKRVIAWDKKHSR